MVHSEALFRFARRLARSLEEAEDLLQETFLKALRSFHQYTPGTNCKSWLFRIMHNLHRQKWRKKSSRVTHLPIEQDGDEYLLHRHLLEQDETYRENPEKKVLEAMPSPSVLKALEALSEEQREVLLLCDVEELPYQEAAEALGVPIGTVRSRLNRARGRMQRLLLAHRDE